METKTPPVGTDGCIARIRSRVARLVGNSTSRIDSTRIDRLVSKLPKKYKDAVVTHAVMEMAAERVRFNQYKVEEAARKLRYEANVRANKERMEKEEADRRARREMEKKAAEAKKKRAEEYKEVANRSKMEQLSVKWGPAKDHPEMAYTKLKDAHYSKTGEKISFPGNGVERREFRKWMKDAGHDLDEWVESAKRAARKEGIGVCGEGVDKKIEFIEADWYEGGVWRYHAMKEREKLYEAARQLIEDTEKRVRLEVTEELLNSEFALGDGTVVSWGEATVGDHEARISVLQGNIAGNAKTAALHLAAIKLIKKSKVTCLKETV